MIAPVRGSKCSVSCTTCPPASSELALARDLGVDPALDEAERVHVLQLGLGAELRRCPPGRTEMLASQRSEPSSMFTSLTPSWRSVARSSRSHSRPARRERRSGSVTISTSGVPPRLKSTTPASEPWMRPLAPTWIELGRVLLEVHAVDAHVAELAAAAQRLVVLGDLVALGQVGIEVVLAVEDRARRELAARAPGRSSGRSGSPARWPPAARRAGRGRPGRCACSAARRSDSSQPQNIFVRVASWTWISRPMTGS